MMQTLLELDGFQVVTASDGGQAVKLAGELHPDAILMDINLPNCDGLSATRQIRRDQVAGRIPIIALTAYDTSDSREQALAAGCTEFMLKPVDFERLEDLLERVFKVFGKGSGSAGRPAQLDPTRPGKAAGSDQGGHSTDHLHNPHRLFDARNLRRMTR